MAETGAGHEAEQIKDTIWTYTQYAVVLLVCVGAGVFIGYTMWGDADVLRRDLSAATEQVNSLKNERENLSSKLALTTREYEVCQQKLKTATP
jgi:hypothetical protein